MRLVRCSRLALFDGAPHPFPLCLRAARTGARAPAASAWENVWAGATATVSVATKWGRSRPLQCITRVQTARRAMCKLYAPNNFALPLSDVDGDGDGYVCLSRTRHLSVGEKAFESHYDPSPSTATEASETKNVKGKSQPAPARARVPIVFDRRFW